MENEDSSLLRRQSGERAFDRVAVVDRERGIGRQRALDRQSPHMQAPSPMSPRFHVTGVDDDAMEPDVVSRQLPQARQLPPDLEEGALDRILGPVGVAQLAIGDRLAAVAVEADERVERGSVAALRPFDQARSHDCATPGAPGLGRLRLNGRYNLQDARLPGKVR